MQFSTAAVVAFLASTAFAAPVAEPDRNMMATTAQWTIQSFTRTCNSQDTSCTYSFGINPKDAAVTQCTYTVTAASKASRASSNGIKCGPFTSSSNWSGQFGDNNGFTTWAIVRNKQIIYPSYSDSQIKNGKAVTPDQSYTPQNLP